MPNALNQGGVIRNYYAGQDDAAQVQQSNRLNQMQQTQFGQQQDDRRKQQLREDGRAFAAGIAKTPKEQRAQVYSQWAPQFASMYPEIAQHLPQQYDDVAFGQLVGRAKLFSDAEQSAVLSEFAPQTPDLTTTQRDAKAYATDPNVRNYVDRQRPADVANELRRIENERKAEEAAAKREQEKRDRFAKDSAVIDSAGDTLRLLDQMVGSEDGRTKPHPGMSSAVGVKGVTGGLLGGWVLPGSDAADFMTFHKQVGGKQFLEAFESLKGGGQITQVEGEKATQAIARMDTAQDEKAYKAAARDFQVIIRRGIERKRLQQTVGGDSRMPNVTVAPQSGSLPPGWTVKVR